jgi:phosphatidylglycerol:prolipoprotein diacylglycerol transferase
MRDVGSIGKLFGVYLILSGVARFLVEFIRLNPRSFLGMTNAQTASLVGTIVGAFLLVRHRNTPQT